MVLWVSGLEKRPKCPIIIHDIEPGKPCVLLMGSKVVRPRKDTDGLGIGKKQMIACNGQYRDKCLNVKACRRAIGHGSKKKMFDYECR